jgi:hypothetical protein
MFDRARDAEGKRKPRRHHKNHHSAEDHAKRRKAQNAARPKQVCIVVAPGECFWTRGVHEGD